MVLKGVMGLRQLPEAENTVPVIIDAKISDLFHKKQK